MFCTHKEIASKEKNLGRERGGEGERERTGPFLKFWYRISILSVSVLRAHVPLLAEFFPTKKKTFFKAESKKTTTTTH